VLTKAEDKLKN